MDLGVVILLGAIVAGFVGFISFVFIFTGGDRGPTTATRICATLVFLVAATLSVTGFILDTRPCTNEASVLADAQSLVINTNTLSAPTNPVRAYAQITHAVEYTSFDSSNIPYLKSGYKTVGSLTFVTLYLGEDTASACLEYNATTTNWSAQRHACGSHL
jgi:hypothetical protein